LFSRMILVKKSVIIIIVLSPANSGGKPCFVHSVSTSPSPARANGTCGSLT
jgi:hypothetical protein